jgi:hypothetical protein
MRAYAVVFATVLLAAVGLVAIGLWMLVRG